MFPDGEEGVKPTEGRRARPIRRARRSSEAAPLARRPRSSGATEKDATLAEKDAEKEAALAEKDAALAEKEAS